MPSACPSALSLHFIADSDALFLEILGVLVSSFAGSIPVWGIVIVHEHVSKPDGDMAFGSIAEARQVCFCKNRS
jgi:hypothetical protein